MVKLIEILILVAPGVCIALWPRTFWWSRWEWWRTRELTPTELLVARVCGVVMAIGGLALAQLYVL